MSQNKRKEKKKRLISHFSRYYYLVQSQGTPRHWGHVGGGIGSKSSCHTWRWKCSALQEVCVRHKMGRDPRGAHHQEGISSQATGEEGWRLVAYALSRLVGSLLCQLCEADQPFFRFD